MKRTYKILFIILLIIVNIFLFVKVKIRSLKYKNFVLRGFLDESTIKSMKNCFLLRNQESIDCYAKNQRKIFNNLKKRFNSNYNGDHARWSDGSKILTHKHIIEI